MEFLLILLFITVPVCLFIYIYAKIEEKIKNDYPQHELLFTIAVAIVTLVLLTATMLILA